MPSEHQLLSEIQNHANALAQAVAAAEFWQWRNFQRIRSGKTDSATAEFVSGLDVGTVIRFSV